jgi:glutaminyl-peptide cyclotransferase
LDNRFFGEGLTELNSRIYQMTYKENTMFTYSTNAGVVRPEHVMAFAGGEEWGLTQIDDQLVVSNGSAKLRFVDPTSLQTTREIQVRHDGKAFNMLNELEAAHGQILANIFGADWVAMINPKNGCIEGTIDLSQLKTNDLEDASEAQCAAEKCVKGDFATNGIAFDSKKDELYFTGKNWPYIFVFKYPL